MSKKYLILLSVVILTFISVSANDSGFISAIRNCSQFSDSGTVNTSGMEVKSTKKISGWHGDRCVYNEQISMLGINSVITCRFTKSQIAELASVMEAYELVQQYSGQSSDFSDMETAQNTAVSKVWSKYLQDSSVCTVTTDQQEE